MTIKVLFADDSKVMRKAAEITFFDSTKFKLELASNGQEALIKAEQMKPDVIIADIDMPYIDGYELCRRIKEDKELSTIKVILLSGVSSPYDEGKGRFVKVDAHIKKPFETSTLINKVIELADKKAMETTKPSFATTQKLTPVFTVSETKSKPHDTLEFEIPKKEAKTEKLDTIEFDISPTLKQETREKEEIKEIKIPPPPPELFGKKEKPTPTHLQAPEKKIEPQKVAISSPQRDTVPEQKPQVIKKTISFGMGTFSPVTIPKPTTDVKLEEEKLEKIDVDTLAELAQLDSTGQPEKIDIEGAIEVSPTIELEKEEALSLGDFGLEEKPKEFEKEEELFSLGKIEAEKPAREETLLTAVSEKISEKLETIESKLSGVTPSTLSKEEIMELAKKIIEEIVWEVVPELAERIIREKLSQLLEEE